MWMNMRAAVAALGVGLCASGCGGGGGDSAALAVTFDPQSITQTFSQHFTESYVDALSPTVVNVTATFASAPPTDVVKIRVLEDQPVLQYTDLAVGQDGLRFTTGLVIDQMLAPGTYDGNFTLQLCRDQACDNRVALTHDKIHYTFTVQAGFRVILDINGVEVTNPTGAVPGTANTEMYVDAPSGGLLALTSAIPVDWTITPQLNPVIYSTDSACTDTNSTTVRNVDTDTALSLVVQNHSGRTCSFLLTATQKSGTVQASYLVTIDPS